MKLDQKVAYLAQHNVDSGAFIACPIANHEAPHFTPSMGLHSNNVKKGHNGRKAAKAALGVTGGHVEFASGQTAANAKRNARKPARKGTMRSRKGKLITFM